MFPFSFFFLLCDGIVFSSILFLFVKYLLHVNPTICAEVGGYVVNQRCTYYCEDSLSTFKPNKSICCLILLEMLSET